MPNGNHQEEIRRRLFDLFAETERKAYQLGCQLKEGTRKIFFYAGGGFDWQPLHRFSHLCDCFVYVDPRKTRAEFDAAVLTIGDQHTAVRDRLTLRPEHTFQTVTEARHWGFTAGDFGDLPAFAAELSRADNTVSAYLMAQLSNETRQALNQHQGPNMAAEQLKTALANDLNRIMDDFVIYDANRFANVTLSEETQTLLAQCPLGEDDALHLNQLLLEDAYPAQISTEPRANENLAQSQNEEWTGIPNLQERQPWGAVLQCSREVGERSRTIWLVFIGGSPLEAYRRLFIRTGKPSTAPHFLAIPTPEFAPADPAPAGGLEHLAEQWRAYAGYQGQLGRLIQDNNAPLPKLLVADRSLNWPTCMPHYSIPQWRNQGQTEVHTLTRRGWRHVTITRNPLDPASARAVGAVVVMAELFQTHHYWPDGVLVIINGLEPGDPNLPAGDGVVNCNIVGKPLHEALKLLEEVCAERGITKLAIQGLPGFEDEADDLAAWRQQEGRIKELILHVECDGHFIDYAPVADVID